MLTGGRGAVTDNHSDHDRIIMNDVVFYGQLLLKADSQPNRKNWESVYCCCSYSQHELIFTAALIKLQKAWSKVNWPKKYYNKELMCLRDSWQECNRCHATQYYWYNNNIINNYCWLTYIIVDPCFIRSFRFCWQSSIYTRQSPDRHSVRTSGCEGIVPDVITLITGYPNGWFKLSK